MAYTDKEFQDKCMKKIIATADTFVQSLDRGFKKTWPPGGEGRFYTNKKGELIIIMAYSDGLNFEVLASPASNDLDDLRARFTSLFEGEH